MLEPRKKKKRPGNKWAAVIPILLVMIVSVVIFNGKALSTLTNVDKKIEFQGQEWNMAESFNKDWQTNNNPVTFTVDLQDDFNKANLQGQNVQAPFKITAEQNENPISVTDIAPVGGADFAGKYTVKIPVSTDGEIDINIEFINDESWKLDSETKTFTITRDTTSPTVKLSGAENGTLTNQDVKIDVEVIEEHFAAEEVKVTVSKNGNPYNVGDWGTGKSKSYTFSEEGEYLFTVKASDKVGNESAQEQLNFAIRKKAPELAVFAGETPLSRGEVSKTDNVNLKISSKIKIESASVTVLKDGEQIETMNFPAGDWETTLNYATPGEGEYEFQVKVREKHAKGEEHSLPSFSFTADKTAPKLAILDVENDGLYETDKEVKVTVDEAHMGNSHFEIRKKDINGEETSKSVDVKDGKATYKTNGEGQYTVTLNATDAAGNKAAEKSVTFKVDKDGPILSISEDVNGKYFKTDKELTFSVKDISLVKANLNVKKDGEPYTIGTFIEKLFTSTVTHNFTEEGAYEVDLNSKDGKEREKSHPPVTFTIDKNDPVITASAVEKVKDEKKYYELTVDVTDKYIDWNNTSMKVLRNGQTLSEITGKEVAKTHVIEEDGEYGFEITATDKAGRVTTKNDLTFTIDNTDPQLFINGVENGGYYQKLENLELAIEDLTFVLGETKLEVTKDGEPYDIGKNEWSVLPKGGLKRAVKKLSFDQDGDYEISLITTDLFGNKNTLEPVKFTIDTIPPELKIENVSDGDESGKDLNVKVSVTDKNMDLDKTFLNVTRNGEEYLAETGQKVSGVHPFTEDGIYVISLESTDKAGNKKSHQQLTFTVDKSKPTLDITGFEVGEHYQKLEGVELSVEDLTLDLSETKIEVLKDGKPYEIENGDWDEVSKGVLKRATRKLNFDEDGDYEIKLTSMDRVKNLHSFGPVKFTIDNTNPVIELSGIGEGDFVQKGKSVKVKVTEHNFNDNKVTIEATKDGKPYDFGKWENKDEVTELSHIFNEDGDYQITVNAIDRAKKEAQSQTLNFTVDNIKPVIKVTGAKNNAYYKSDKEIKIEVEEHNFANNKVDIKVTRKEEVDGSSVNFPIGEWKNVKELSEISHQFDRDGEYQINVEAKDAAGNAADTQTLLFTLDYIEPELSITGVSDAEHYRTDKPVSMKIADRNIDLTQTELKVVRNGQPYKIGNPELKGKTAAEKLFTFSQEGSYVIDLNTTDKAGNSKKHDKVAFIIDKTNPGVKIDGVENNSFNPENKNVTISIDELNYETNDVSISATKDGAAFSIGSWKNTGKLSKLGYNFNRDGLYTIQATAKDKAGNGPIAEKRTFTIDKTKPEIEITGVENNAYYNVDKPVNVSIRDVNLDINKITVTRNGARYNAGGFSLNGNLASLRHNFSGEGEYNIVVEATDKAGNSFSKTMKFTIDKTKPVITPKFKGQNRVIKDGEYINEVFTPEFALAEAEDMIVSATLNNGANLGKNIPVAAREMKYIYKVLARDKAGNESTLEISFTLDTTKPMLNISGILDGFFNKDIIPKVTYSDIHLDRSKTSVTLNGKPFENGTKLEYEQDYILKAVITDLANNVSSRTIVFTIDKTKPVIKFKEPISNKYFNSDLLPQLLIEDMNSYDIIAMMLDGKPYEAGDPIKEEGKHVMFFEVKDKAGNIQQLSVEFIIDKTAPKVVYEGVKNKEKYYDPVDISISLDNPNDKIKSVMINGEMFEGDVVEENGYQVIKTKLAEIKPYEIKVTATDEAGNEKTTVISFEIVEKGALVKFYENKPLLGGTVAGLVGLIGAAATVLIRRRKLKVEEE